MAEEPIEGWKTFGFESRWTNFGQRLMVLAMVVSCELIFLITRDPCARELKWGGKKVFVYRASETLFYVVLPPVVIPLALALGAKTNLVGRDCTQGELGEAGNPGSRKLGPTGSNDRVDKKYLRSWCQT